MSRPACTGWCHPDGCICRPARLEMPADVRRYALAYTRAEDRGDMLRALELRAAWPAGLLECSCERGATRDGEDDCDLCGGIGLYYQPDGAESEAA